MASTSLAPPLAIPTEAGDVPSVFSIVSEAPDSPGLPLPQYEFVANLLQSLLSGDSNLPCPLPPDFAAALLRTDEDGAAGEAGMNVAEGLPSYPLYKYLARALIAWIVSGTCPRTLDPVPGIAEDETRKAKIEKWTPTIVELGSQLLELGRGVEFQLHVQEPYFSQLRDGTKTVEGRCASGAYNKMQAGDSVLFNQSLLLKVEDVKRYSTFSEMMEAEGLSSVLPGVTSIAEGVQVYRSFYSEEREQAGVLGIRVQDLSDLRQPLKLLYDVLNELCVEGVRTLLGMRSTMGSVEGALPPPASALLSAFVAVQHETLAGSKLTVGARALAKHVHRSSCGWWGSYTGTESSKNEIAVRKISGMMVQTIWMNVHTVPIPVFEIRVKDGYGARWMADGTQFRGFLEPPMEDAYLNKWRH